MKKKPVIITIVIVAVAAILIGGGVYLYPHLVERTISQVADNDMTDIVKISLNDRNVGNKVIEVTDKEDIEEIAESIAEDWELTADIVKDGLTTLLTHLKSVKDGVQLLYEMT